MIFRLSRALCTKVKAGALGAMPPHENPLLDWSAHVFVVDRKQFILLCNTGSLLAVVVEGKEVTNEDSFRERAFEGMQAFMASLGYDSAFQTVISASREPLRFAKPLNRSVLGSMNDLIRCAKSKIRSNDFTAIEIIDRLNIMPMSMLAMRTSRSYAIPRDVFREMVNKAGFDADRSPTGDRHNLPG